MKTSLMVNNNIVPLNDFMQDYVANILWAIVKSFDVSCSNVTICADADEFHIYTDKGEIDISKKDFARQLIESTVKGMLSPLKGIFWFQKITITAKIEQKITVQG
ncbi:hypothetical protein [Dissulfurispira thermophila]|nr:hypothetical protein [Dissulfurispira thermophila]